MYGCDSFFATRSERNAKVIDDLELELHLSANSIKVEVARSVFDYHNK